MRIVGPVTLYCHGDCREYVDTYRKRYAEEGWDDAALDNLEQFMESRPLYEVGFEFYLDLDSGRAHCTKVDLGDGEPFTRDCPGQQLTLF